MPPPDLAISASPGVSAAVALLAASQLPTQDLTDRHLDHFFFAGSRDAPNGLVGLELFGDVALLRSLVVAESLRGNGAGAALVRHAEDYARARGVKRVYLLTITAEGFFARRGYVRDSRETAPVEIRNTREFSSLCPAGSAFMSKQL
jgi:amino-acid N-acetyltransferase